MKLKDIFENLELELTNIEKTKKYLLYILIIVAITALNYQYFLGQYIQEHQNKQAKVKKFEKELRHRLVPAIKLKIKRNEKEKLQLLEKIDSLDFEILNLRSKVDSTKTLFLTDEVFAQFLNKILKDSKRRGIVINNIVIEDLKNSQQYMGKVYLVKKLKISGVGNYLKIETFLRNIEKQDILQKIDKLIVETDINETKFLAEISIFGDIK